MPSAARYSLVTAVALVAVAWIAGFALNPVASALADASAPHRLSLVADVLIVLFFGGHFLAFVALTAAGVSASVAFAQRAEARTVRRAMLIIIIVCLWLFLAFFIWRGLLHQY